MKKALPHLFVLVAIALGLDCYRAKMLEVTRRLPEISIIPKPTRMERIPGEFVLRSDTRIFVPEGNPVVAQVARYLVSSLGSLTQLKLEVPTGKKISSKNTIRLGLCRDDRLGEEGYRLVITPEEVTLEGNQPRALFYGVQTLLQLLPPVLPSSFSSQQKNLSLPGVSILDRPRYRWRGMMLDVSRHFFPKEFILDFIDYLAIYKLNTFHWHLNDDQGWRIEIKRYPKLTEIGAWRVDREDQPWNVREPQRSGEPATYGGFYTQEEIREIVAYARSRFITIVPEIEMPGHCLAALAAYPQYSCTGGPYTVPPGGVWPIKDIYCAGNDSTFEFLQNILTEVFTLFPGRYLHIGGDEVDKMEWKQCPRCQERIRSEGLSDEEELQSYFIRRIEKFLNEHGKSLIGWDEILQGGLAPNATVMSWRGTEGGIAAARLGHDVVMTPTSYCYFDYYQGAPESEPLAIGGYLPISQVYAFDPTPEELTPEEAGHVLGVQGNLWSEYIATPEHAQYMIFPRIAALAEVAWTSREQKNWDEFFPRLSSHLHRYEQMGIHAARSVFSLRMNQEFDPKKRKLHIKLESEINQGSIRYTLDGSAPTLNSRRYRKPIRINKTGTLRAGLFLNGVPAGSVLQVKILIHLGFGRPVRRLYPYDERYDGGGEYALTDGLRGSKSFRDGRWQGYEGDNLIAEIDLGKRKNIRRISTGFLQNIASWIFFPRSVEFALSNDGVDYETVATIPNEIPLQTAEIMTRDFSASFSPTEARFVRVRAENVAVCPDWHPGAGEKAWIFVDEVVVE